MKNLVRKAISTTVCSLLALAPLGAAPALVVPMDLGESNKLAAGIRTAGQEGNYNAVLRDSRRLLELFPNNPSLHAPIYRIMAEAAEKSGESTDATDYRLTARLIDPSLEDRLSQRRGITRGDSGPNWQVALTVVAQGLQAFQAVQAQMQQQKMARQIALAQQQAAQQQAAMQQAAQQQMAQQQAGQQQMPQQQPAISYPTAPIADPNFQPNAAMNGPMPGWNAAPGSAMPQYPVASGLTPPAYQQQPQPQYQQPQPQYQQPQPQYQQPQPQFQQPQPQAQGQPLSGQPPYPAYPQGPAPYQTLTYAAPVGAMRGAKDSVIKVIHDHSQGGDKNYFEKSCGALLSVSGANLTFTPSGGEAPAVIPVGEIREIRLNSSVGKDAGAFHIATRKGLYMNLAPESATRESGRETVRQLRKQLGLSE